MMNRIVTLFAIVALLGLSTDRALATDLGGSTNMSTIQASVTGDGIINLNANGTLTMDANGTGVSTISVAAGVAAVIQFNATTNTIQYKAGAGAITIGGGGSLTIAGSNTSAGIDYATNNTSATLTVNESIAGGVSVDVLTGKTLTVTNGLSFAGNTLTLTGAGTIARVDATTGTITDNAGTTITDLRITPGGATFTWNGTGAGTVTDFLTNSTFATGDIISKTGTGSLTITGGVATFFSTAGTEIIKAHRPA